jgi:hypothetical protein
MRRSGGTASTVVLYGLAMARHRRWLFPLIAAVAVYAVHSRSAAWIVVALALAGVAYLQARRTHRARLRGGGGRRRGETERDKTERSMIAPARSDEATRRAWDGARELRRMLLARQTPATVAVWDVVPYAGESFFCDVPISYARYYGTNASYARTSGFFFGRPTFVLAGLAATAVTNAARRSAAQNAAREQWREHATGRLVVSNERLLVQVGGRWLSFHYAAMTAVYPEPGSWALVCQFEDAEPLLLSGIYAPFAAVMTAFRTHGAQALVEHPGLQPLADQSGTASWSG